MTRAVQCAEALACAALVTGDCLPLKKPDPAPILRACEIAGVAAAAELALIDALEDLA